MAYSSIAKPTDYFNTKLYTANATSGHAITGIGHQPDWLWIKQRSNTYNHEVFDSVRGATKRLLPNDTDAETTVSGVTSFDSDGFTLGDAYNANKDSGDSIVAWSWKAGGSASSNGDGSVTSSVSANTTAGFSICTWTATGSAHTVGHGLGVAPSLIIVKKRHEANSWLVYHDKNTSAPETDYLELQSTAATADYPVWNDTAPTSSVFSIGTWSGNDASGTLVGYCFAEKKGYSKMGAYRGSSGNSFIYTGFKPAFLLVKSNSYSSGNWRIYDNKRSTSGFNVIDDSLRPNTTAAEIDETSVDFLSNGFKYRANVTDADSGGTDYIYYAVAESPFVGNDSGTAVPVTAR